MYKRQELIILDEPFSGFDPVNADIIKNEILELNKQGATFIFSTHRMESVEELCDQIALINRSKKILDGSVDEIKATYRNNTYWIEYEGDYNVKSVNDLFDVLQTENVKGKKLIKIQLHTNKTVNEVLSNLLPLISISKLDEVIPTMNEIFIDKVKRQDYE